ncbi:uncharacterized protein LOC133717408 isoform X1 [Rosa rugosa]|uniref:uncharacterized protein LOC133717408 isoform X1 n=2 Tax=Rosa rugosa TaxID=74645 RepID=UPI002B40C520|nr:uncharacterized protein LOC133717408 isoform X1 [Rosa rugosa]
MSAAEETGTMDEEVLRLKEQLSQCELQRELLLTEKESWMAKERLVTQEKEAAEEKLRAFIKATSSARSEFEKKRKTLKEALETKKKSVHQLNKAIDEFLAGPDVNYMGKRTPTMEKFDRLIAEIRKKKMCLQAETDKVDKLHSEILEKRDNLFSFLKTCVKNSEITDDVKPVLRLHYDAYVDTVKTEDDDCEMLRKYVHFILQPFVRLDFKSPISAAMSKFFNFFLTKESNKDAEHKHPVRDDDESEHPDEASIGRKLLDFIIT